MPDGLFWPNVLGYGWQALAWVCYGFELYPAAVCMLIISGAYFTTALVRVLREL